MSNIEIDDRKKQIIEKIARGEMCLQEELGECRYYDLEKYIDNQSPEEAVCVMNNLFALNLLNIRRRGKVKVAFVVYSSSEWQCEDLYRKMEDDSIFEPVVFLCTCRYGEDQQIYSTYRETCKYFIKSDKTYNVVYGGCQQYSSFRNRLDEYDIVIYCMPFENLQPQQNNAGSRKLNQLLLHIPYGIYHANKEDACYHDFYNQLLFKCCWVYFCETALHKAEAERAQRLRAYNIMVSGLPKLDPVLENRVTIRSWLWKNAGRESIRLIWAPHFNMEKGKNGTFHENYQWFFQYAKEHPEIMWIVRPHPRMEAGALYKGVFKDSDDYQAYLQQWDELPNAQVIAFGDYLDIFMTSDAMILDSMSFLSEYQYTGKPLLFLQSEQPRSLSGYGKELVSHLYQARGNDFEKISEFIDMVQKHEDPMRKERKVFYDTYLNYLNFNGLSASQFIVDTIKSAVGDGKREV